MFKLLTLVWVCFSAIATPVEILFIRHGQAVHNVLIHEKKYDEARNTRDPELTPTGVEQAKQVQYVLSDYPVDRVVVSPLARTMNTASIIFSGHAAPMVVMSDLIEYCHDLSCRGSDRSILEERFPNVQLGELSEQWHESYIDESSRHFHSRVDRFKSWLYRQDAKRMAVVSHGGFLEELLGVYFKNCEVVRASFTAQGELVIH